MKKLIKLLIMDIVKWKNITRRTVDFIRIENPTK